MTGRHRHRTILFLGGVTDCTIHIFFLSVQYLLRNTGPTTAYFPPCVCSTKDLDFSNDFIEKYQGNTKCW
jgi:hypothetical protein